MPDWNCTLILKSSKRVLYYDTDSVIIFKSVPGLYEPHTSDQIGGMTDELEGDFITEFVSNGAKTYAYTTNKGKQVVKCKGFTLNKLASDRLTLDAMKHLVTANQDSISVTQDVIRSEAINEESGPKAIIFDDLMNECVDNVLIQSAFTKKRHHNNVSVILLLQNLFCQGKMMRTIHLNTEYVVVFGNARDKSQFHHFCRQVEPNNSRNLVNAYIEATSKPYAHFLVDLKPLIPNILRYRSNSLSSDEQIVYLVNGM